MDESAGEGWVELEAPLEPLVWGRSTYVVIRLPAVLDETCRAAATRRVEGWVDEVEVNLGLNRADVVTGAFVYAGRPLQRRLRAAAGDVVSLRLRPADPDLVPVPDDVRRALADAGRLAAFEQRRPAERRRLLAGIEAAATRRARTSALLDTLR